MADLGGRRGSGRVRLDGGWGVRRLGDGGRLDGDGGRRALRAGLLVALPAEQAPHRPVSKRSAACPLTTVCRIACHAQQALPLHRAQV